MLIVTISCVGILMMRIIVTIHINIYSSDIVVTMLIVIMIILMIII